MHQVANDKGRDFLRSILMSCRHKIFDLMHRFRGVLVPEVNKSKSSTSFKWNSPPFRAKSDGFRRCHSDSTLLLVREQALADLKSETKRLPVEEIRLKWREKQLNHQKQLFVHVNSSWRLKQIHSQPLDEYCIITHKHRSASIISCESFVQRKHSTDQLGHVNNPARSTLRVAGCQEQMTKGNDKCLKFRRGKDNFVSVATQ